ncbi:Ribonuclease H domain - like 10 [Theobroma cacao]|nr:Ribonuclease H domain - like 10 [Theobroma cacao]
MWQLMHGRTAVKAELLQRGLLSENNALCSLCKNNIKTVDHLFVNCDKLWIIWYSCCRQRGVTWVMPRGIKELVVIWNATCLNNGDKRIWVLTTFAISWTIWLYQNDVVFQNSCWNSKQVWDLIHLRIATWANANWPNQHGSLLDVYRHPNSHAIQNTDTRRSAATNWNRPIGQKLKYNVAGPANGSQGEAGIGGMLRSENGVVLARFSKNIVGKFSLVIESDSLNAVKWVKSPNDAPWRLRKWISHIESSKKMVGDWEICHVLREGNKAADKLAKGAIQRVPDLMETSDDLERGLAIDIE